MELSMNVKIAPSILSADFSKLGDEIIKLESAGADLLHIDVMDGHFVPNLTIGPCVIKDIKKVTHLDLDVHLMISNPESFIGQYIQSGATTLTFHLEATNNAKELLSEIRSKRCRSGISIKPQTPVMLLDDLYEYTDHVLIMTVNPGFGGQEFMTNQLQKISHVRNMINRTGRNISLAVDGGINNQTAKDAIKAGADILVAGSYIFQSTDYRKQIKLLRG
jgi:ribulose-phosphate 3-epimerase